MFYLTNKGDSVISNVTGKIRCDDPWIKNIVPSTWSVQSLLPQVSTATSSFFVSRIDSLFPGFFNFSIEIAKDSWIYWKDSLRAIVGVEDKTPVTMDYKLGQNYPNPFNPKTVISYQLPFSGYVTLKVYNILGREVIYLVNEYKPAGIYDVEFSAYNLPSGVYFYQLRAGSFAETRKMVIIR